MIQNGTGKEKKEKKNKITEQSCFMTTSAHFHQKGKFFSPLRLGWCTFCGFKDCQGQEKNPIT